MPKQLLFWLFTICSLSLLIGCKPKEQEKDSAPQAGVASSSPGEPAGGRPRFDPEEFMNRFKPTLFANLGDLYYTPDGMTVNAETGVMYLNVPNFGRMDENYIKPDSHQGGYLLQINQDGTFEELLQYPVLESTGQCGPMGIDFGPDGNLYVCDNQYFHNNGFQKNTDAKSRILRVVMKDGKPTGEVQTVIDGIKLANAVQWSNNRLFYTDSCLDTEDPNSEEFIGSGALFMFEGEDVLKAGIGETPAIKVNAAADDPHCLAFEKVKKIGRGDNTGADGMAIDSTSGVIYFGHFGNGALFAVYPNEDGTYQRENVINIYDPTALEEPMPGPQGGAAPNSDSNQPSPEGQSGAPNNPPRRFPRGPFGDLKLQCCDGMFFDQETQQIFINDSQNNAIWAFRTVPKGEKARPRVIWKNDDTDGNDGLLDQPCECVISNGKMIIVNFDWPFPGLLNSQVDPPGTLSAIDMAPIVEMAQRMNRRGRPEGSKNDAPVPAPETPTP
ncbi:MAG: hypothetical protein Q4C95_04130 [Planctomycetia bacterium]|nr:hypothetical protein [Planctomycetia bacterium]